MKTASALKYDPFQFKLDTMNSSVLDPTKKSDEVTPETARHYGESYLYTPPETTTHSLISAKAVTPSATAAILSGDVSLTIAGNVIRATDERPEAANVVFRNSVYSQPSTRFEVLQKWEGFVLDVLSDSFTARLLDLTSEGSDEEAEFAMSEIDEDDKDLLSPGAVFYWNIGYSDSPSGRSRVSTIRFRRLPVWRSEELERAKDDAERLSSLLEWK